MTEPAEFVIVVKCTCNAFKDKSPRYWQIQGGHRDVLPCTNIYLFSFIFREKLTKIIIIMLAPPPWGQRSRLGNPGSATVRGRFWFRAIPCKKLVLF